MPGYLWQLFFMARWMSFLNAEQQLMRKEEFSICLSNINKRDVPPKQQTADNPTISSVLHFLFEFIHFPYKSFVSFPNHHTALLLNHHKNIDFRPHFCELLRHILPHILEHLFYYRTISTICYNLAILSKLS